MIIPSMSSPELLATHQKVNLDVNVEKLESYPSLLREEENDPEVCVLRSENEPHDTAEVDEIIGRVKADLPTLNTMHESRRSPSLETSSFAGSLLSGAFSRFGDKKQENLDDLIIHRESWLERTRLPRTEIVPEVLQSDFAARVREQNERNQRRNTEKNREVEHSLVENATQIVGKSHISSESRSDRLEGKILNFPTEWMTPSGPGPVPSLYKRVIEREDPL